MTQLYTTDVSLNDAYPLSTRTTTSNGYLKATARLTRTGIFNYLGSELGLNDENASKIIRVYKPSETIFNDLNAYKGLDITYQHPDEYINSNNYMSSNQVVGVVISSGTRDAELPDYVTCEVLIKDAKAIAAINSGCVEMSLGATSTLVFQNGVTPEGLEFDAIVKEQVLNHVAIVPAGRAGAMARILDHNLGGTMNKNTEADKQDVSTIAPPQGADVDTQDTAATLAKLNDTIKQLEDELAQAQAKADALELQLKQKAPESDVDVEAKIQDAINSVIQTLAQAKELAGDDFVCSTYNTREIKEKAIATIDSSFNLNGKSDTYVDAVFDTLYKNKVSVAASHNAVANSLANAIDTQDSVDTEITPIQKYKEQLANAHKTLQ